MCRAELILQAFNHLTYVTAHSDSPSFPSLYLRHNSFSNPSVTSPTSQLILQPFFRLSYVTGFSLTSPGEPPMVSVRELILQAFNHLTYVTAHSDSPSFPSLHLHHSSFSNPSFASPTSQDFHLLHLVSRSCSYMLNNNDWKR